MFTRGMAVLIFFHVEEYINSFKKFTYEYVCIILFHYTAENVSTPFGILQASTIKSCTHCRANSPTSEWSLYLSLLHPVNVVNYSQIDG